MNNIEVFKKGDFVYVDNGVKVNGTPLSEIAAKVIGVASEHLSLQYPKFKYIAHKSDCKKVSRVKEVVNK